MNDAHRPADTGPVDSNDPAAPRKGAPADRRSFLRGIAALAAGVGGGALLGESLLVRGVYAQPGPIPTEILTHSGSYTITSSGTIPRTETKSGTLETMPGDPATFSNTSTRANSAVSTYSRTATYPAAGGKTQTITVAGTRTLSYTPPMTITQSYSLRGASYTLTIARDPTYWTCTMSDSYTWQYVASEGGGDDDDTGGGMAGVGALVLDRGRADLETLDVDGLALFDPLHRHGEPALLRFADGAAR